MYQKHLQNSINVLLKISIFWKIGQLRLQFYQWRSRDAEIWLDLFAKYNSSPVWKSIQIWICFSSSGDIRHWKYGLFCLILAKFWFNWPTWCGLNFIKLTKTMSLNDIYTVLKFLPTDMKHDILYTIGRRILWSRVLQYFPDRPDHWSDAIVRKPESYSSSSHLKNHTMGTAS